MPELPSLSPDEDKFVCHRIAEGALRPDAPEWAGRFEDFNERRERELGSAVEQLRDPERRDRGTLYAIGKLGLESLRSNPVESHDIPQRAREFHFLRELRALVWARIAEWMRSARVAHKKDDRDARR